MSPDFFDRKCRNSDICGKKVGEGGTPFPKVSTLSTRSSSVDADFFSTKHSLIPKTMLSVGNSVPLCNGFHKQCRILASVFLGTERQTE